MKQELFEIDQNGDVFVKDGSGNSIQITDAGSHSAGSVAINGLLPGMIVTKDQLSVSTTISTVHPTYQDAGLSVTFEASANENVLLTFSGALLDTSTAGDGAYLAYQIDGGADVPLFTQSGNAASFQHNGSFSIPVTGLSSGSHTIKLRAARDINNWTIHYAAGSNVPTLAVIQYRGAGLNGLEVVESVLSGVINVSTASPSWQATALTATINTLEGERVEVSYNGAATSTGVVALAGVGYRIDGGTVIPVAGEHMEVSGRVSAIGFSVFTDVLTAGQHTIELMVNKGVNGAWDLTASSSASKSALQVTRFKSFGIGAGTIFTEDFMASTFTTSSSTPSDIGTEVAFTTAVANEVVTVDFLGLGQTTVGNVVTGSLILQLKVDSDAATDTLSVSALADENSLRHNLSFSKTITIPTPGAHTIKLLGWSSSASSWQMLVDANTIQLLQVTQHRGGLIPVKDEGVTIVEKPTGFNFTGAGVTVSVDGTDAKIDISGTTPSSHASTHVDGGADELDGDTLDVTFTPANYTPDAAAPEANDVDDLAAHLKGIDTQLATTGGNEFADDVFRVTGSVDATKKVALEVDGLTTSTTRTMTMPDKDLDLADINTLKLTRQATGISATTNGSSIVGCTAGGITITLATADLENGKVIYIKDEGANATASPITIDTQGAETIDGVVSIQITVDYGVAKLYTDGNSWFTL